MLTVAQDKMAYDALLNTLKASGVIAKDAQPDWPMLIQVANEYIDHLNQVKVKPAVEPMDPEQTYKCAVTPADQLVVYISNEEFKDKEAYCFVVENNHNHKISVILLKTEAIRLRNQLNQLIGD